MTHGCARRSPSLTLIQALLPSAELASHVNAAFREGHEGTAVLPPLVTGIEGKAASSGTGAPIAAEGLVAYMVSRKVGAQIVGVREFANMAG